MVLHSLKLTRNIELEMTVEETIRNVAASYGKKYTGPQPTDGELRMMKVCGDCEHCVPFKMNIKGKVTTHPYCREEMHYVTKNAIQLTCYWNNRFIATRTWWIKLLIFLRLYD